MRKLIFLVGVVFLFSVSASAQGVGPSRIDLFGGYTFDHTSPGVEFSSFNSNGGVGSVALNFTSWGSLVGEVGGIHATHIGGADVDATAMTYMAGPKVSLFHGSPLSPFVEALFGVTRTNPGFNQTTQNHTDFAFSPGVGLDWNASRHFGIRLAQVDYLWMRVPTSTNQVHWNNFRYSTGIVFRF
jgi:peptidoglycan-associated lipoprotein